MARLVDGETEGLGLDRAVSSELASETEPDMKRAGGRTQRLRVLANPKRDCLEAATRETGYWEEEEWNYGLWNSRKARLP